jgi:adenylate kinase
LVESTGISDLFSQFVGLQKIKLLIHDSCWVSSETHVDRLRSLNIEHVSPSELIRQEISRHTQFGLSAERRIRSGYTLSDEAVVSLMRRWFWARKPDAGFALTGFPATLLQAKIFDEWLEAKGEALNGVMVAKNAPADLVVDYYRTLGLLFQIEPSVSS